MQSNDAFTKHKLSKSPDGIWQQSKVAVTKMHNCRKQNTSVGVGIGITMWTTISLPKCALLSIS